MRTEASYLVAYDVVDDGLRVAVAEALLDLGATRLQRSVFWLPTDEAGLVRMRSALGGLIDPDTDRVHWFRTCGNCPGIRERTRAARLPPPDLGSESGAWIV